MLHEMPARLCRDMDSVFPPKCICMPKPYAIQSSGLDENRFGKNTSHGKGFDTSSLLLAFGHWMNTTPCISTFETQSPLLAPVITELEFYG
jgi:hypothetical protein